MADSTPRSGCATLESAGAGAGGGVGEWSWVNYGEQECRQGGVPCGSCGSVTIIKDRREECVKPSGSPSPSSTSSRPLKGAAWYLEPILYPALNILSQKESVSRCVCVFLCACVCVTALNRMTETMLHVGQEAKIGKLQSRPSPA